MPKKQQSLKQKYAAAVKSRISEPTGSHSSPLSQWPHPIAASPSPQPSVHDLLSRFRPPRPRNGNLARYGESKVLDTYASYGHHIQRIESTAAQSNVTVAGPAPPPGWRAAWREAVPVSTPTVIPTDGSNPRVRSLVDLCVDSVAQRIRVYRQRQAEFACVPWHLKERILQRVCETSRLVNDLLCLFRDPEMRVLVLANSSVTVKGLAGHFDTSATPVVAGGSQPSTERKEEEVLESWEDAADLAEITPIVHQRPPFANLHTLSISHAVGITAVPFTHLVSKALPNLYVLDLSGCFDSQHGPHALGILACNLVGLKLLNLSGCKWVTREVVLGVGWEARWREMCVLVVRRCGEGCEGVVEDLRRVRRGLAVVCDRAAGGAEWEGAECGVSRGGVSRNQDRGSYAGPY
ncbi:uncharacterized protein EV422DRAFT_45386 [Fimicolochytrium jonesii]|uniref:uncharacterized protein n=1 Tax=Fimicolochytrium jonesii TaxID=1396493 RepID=UPI0022FF3C9D|nr:uncharacterized protein EV422DRAFT_45386 [Fimicolochytrium jonesii]KAI8821513.1 hypothetical protein EV422DRAFT_45386 [Fimicolochytrium jonesii]